ncbi:MAG: hypothetical protein ACFFG0_48525 [Candidatus Thorarchaeota archaeon]
MTLPKTKTFDKDKKEFFKDGYFYSEERFEKAKKNYKSQGYLARKVKDKKTNRLFLYLHSRKKKKQNRDKK